MVFDICQVVVREPFSPTLLLAIAQQESGYDHTEVRLENGVYRRSSRPKNLTTTDEVLLSASYGLMQTGAWTLYDLGFFGSWTYGGIASRVDAYMEDPVSQVTWGFKVLQDKLKIGGDVFTAVRRYNGSGPMAEKYKTEVLARYDKLSHIYHKG